MRIYTLVTYTMVEIVYTDLTVRLSEYQDSGIAIFHMIPGLCTFSCIIILAPKLEFNQSNVRPDYCD